MECWERVLLMTMLVLVTSCESCLEQERVALLQLKPFFNSHIDLYNWDDEVKCNSDCCEWERVECNSTTNRITRLSLHCMDDDWYLNDRARGKHWYLNASLFLPLEELKSLDLSDNGIAGFVGNEGFALGNLEILNLSGNYLKNDILFDLSGLSSLKTLSLSDNQLEGHIQGLNNLTSLKYLDLSHNRIESISNQDETQLRLLEELDLSYNLFRNNTISFPKSLSSLKSLTVSNNDLQGSLNIKEWRELTNLKKLDLSWNRIESLQTFKDGGTKLKWIGLDGNLFNNSVLKSLHIFSNLISLNIGYNQLKGSIDIKDFDAFNNLRELSMSGNHQLKDFVIHIEKKGLKKLQVVNLDEVFTDGGSISLQNLVEAFSCVKTFSLRGNNVNMTMPTTPQEFNVSGNNVEEIFLDGCRSLNTNILQSIGVFTSIQTLSLSRSGLTGSLPNQGWCDLRNLRVLDLTDNELEGILPLCLGNLTSLRELDFSDNQLTGNLAPLANLTSLRGISLSRNHFQIPTSFLPVGNLPSLKVLLIDENRMVMEPSSPASTPKFRLRFISLSKCTTSQQLGLQLLTFLYYQYDLRFVDLSRNNFSGTVPIWLLGNNTNLKELIMQGNSFTGQLSLLPAPNVKVSSIVLCENKLTGQIPINICLTFPNLRRLFLSKNAFQGNIPPCLSGMKNLSFLDLSNNQLSGSVPEELIMKMSMSILRLSNNNLNGNVVPAILNANGLQQLYLNGNHFSGEMANVDVSTFEFPTSLDEIDLSNNKLYGKLPRWLGNMSYLRRLALSNNSFEGSIPMEICKLNNLEYLELSQNSLSGSIPSCFNPPNMMHVHLHGNRLSGPLSLDVFNSSSLVTLDLRGNNLSGSIPKQISRLSSLSVLLLKGNHLHGEIPVQLCKLHSLSIIDLSQNKFSGPIPSCLGNLTLSPKEYKILPHAAYATFSEDDEAIPFGMFKLTEGIYDYYPTSYIEELIEFMTKSGYYSYGGYILQNLAGIDLSCNNLTGHIPPELGNFSQIHSLNLSHNKLIGPIPCTFSKLEQIESLDLSYNSLSGKIPNQLVNLKSLEVFSVAHNNLSGSIPEPKAQFGTFIEGSYEGNPFLCGPMLNKSCSKPDSSSTTSTASNDDEGEDSLLDIYFFEVSFVVSYVVMLMTVFVVLYINPYWRGVWFSFVEKCITACRRSTVGNFLARYILGRRS